MPINEILFAFAKFASKLSREKQYKKMKKILYLFCLLIISIKTWNSFLIGNEYYYSGLSDFLIKNKGYEIFIIMPIAFILFYAIETRLLPFYIIHFVNPINMHKRDSFNKLKSLMNYDKIAVDAISWINESYERKNDFYSTVCFAPIIATLVALCLFWNIAVIVIVLSIWLFFFFCVPIIKGILQNQ